MGNDAEDGSIKYRFSSEGADQVISDARKLTEELNAAVAAFLRLLEAAKKSKREGGLTGGGPGGGASGGAGAKTISDDLRRIREIRRTYEEELGELRNEYTNSFTGKPNAQQKKREAQLLRNILRTERLEARQAARDAKREEDEARRKDEESMGKQKQHVRWISKIMQMIGLGRYAPTGAVGATILGAMQATGVPGAATAAGGIGAAGIAGLVVGGGAAALGAATWWGNRRTLAANPAHGIGMDIAGYMNPFEAMEKTRLLSKALQMVEYGVMKSAKGIAGVTNDVLKGMVGMAGGFTESGSYFKSVLKSSLLPKAVRKAMRGGNLTDEELAELEANDVAAGRGRIDAGMRRAMKRANTPGINELRFMAGMTGPMMNEFLPQSEFGKKGLYASEGEGIAARSAYVWQDQLIKVLSQLGETMDSIIKEARESRANGSKL